MPASPFIFALKRRDAFMVPARIILNYWSGLRLFSGERPNHAGQSSAEAAAYAQEVAGEYVALLEKVGETFEEKRVLEIGPGGSPIVARLLLEAGASEVVTADRFAFSPKAAFHEEVWEIASPRKNDPTPVGPIEQRTDIAIEGAERILGKGSFDVIVSWSVMEHVQDLAAAYRSIAALLKPGGITIHSIDLGPHGMWTEHHPLYFLTFSDFMWNRMGSRRGIPNRARAPEHRERLESAGLKISHIQPFVGPSEEEIGAIKPFLNQRFASIAPKELQITRLLLVAKKDPQ